MSYFARERILALGASIAEMRADRICLDWPPLRNPATQAQPARRLKFHGWWEAGGRLPPGRGLELALIATAQLCGNLLTLGLRLHYSWAHCTLPSRWLRARHPHF